MSQSNADFRTRTQRWRQLPYWFAAVAIFAGCTVAGVQRAGDLTPREGAPVLLDELGGRSIPVTTSNALAQRYFDQGMALVYGFNHGSAIDAFDEAAALDPQCASCFWGKALALGPNINAPLGPDGARAAFAALQQAQAVSAGATEKERALIDALAERYVEEPGDDRSALDAAYADAMQKVQARYPDDTDIATLTAEAHMDRYPWAYWTADAEPREYTGEIIRLLEWVLEREPGHIGANHYYIHAVEEHFPDKAEDAADRLATLAPDAGHLVHMPSHIYWRVGRYGDAAEVNQAASAADENYFAQCKPGALYRALYYPHNVHFLWAAASARGQSELALTAARKLAQEVEALHTDFPFVEEFLTVPQLTLVRFGRWDAVLGEPKPADGRVFQTGMWHYARGVAYAKLGKLAEARGELAAVQAHAADGAAAEMFVAGGVATAEALLGLGADHLEGEIAAAAGDRAAAIASFERAVAQQDGLAYMEPPPWYYPIRQTLGAELLEADRAADAEAVYREDLVQYPKNGWSFFGLAASLEAQGREAEANMARAYHEKAFDEADVELAASAF